MMGLKFLTVGIGGYIYTWREEAGMIHAAMD